MVNIHVVLTYGIVKVMYIFQTDVEFYLNSNTTQLTGLTHFDLTLFYYFD